MIHADGTMDVEVDGKPRRLPISHVEVDQESGMSRAVPEIQAGDEVVETLDGRCIIIRNVYPVDTSTDYQPRQRINDDF